MQNEPPGNDSSFQNKVEEWLRKEGYPLEFATASAFRQAGFRVRQGEHVRNPDTGVVREIDVVASIDGFVGDQIVRLSYIIECKWSKNKPWIIFTSMHHRIAPGACIAQTIGSDLGRAALWCVAGNSALHQTSTFSTPDGAGFGARQAFSDGKDVCYSALQSVVSAARLRAMYYETPSRDPKHLPRVSFVALPTVVVDGALFEAYFDEDSGELKTHPANAVRLHWRGAESWQHFATVDVVAASYLNEFLAKRAEESTVIINALVGATTNIAECFAVGNLDALKYERASRGIVGLPPLLAHLAKKVDQAPPA
jgi:hypothetical protein